MLAGKNQPTAKSPKYGMATYDSCKKGRGEGDEQDQGDDALRRPVLEAAGAAEEPVKSGLDGAEEEEHEAGAGEEDPEGGQATTGIDKGDTEGEENPACVNVRIRTCEGIGLGLLCLPTTSLATPAASVMTPTVVSRSFNSVRIRHRTGKACAGD